MSKPTKGTNDVRQTIRKVAQEVSKWPQWKRGGSAAAKNPTAAGGTGKKPQAG